MSDPSQAKPSTEPVEESSAAGNSPSGDDSPTPPTSEGPPSGEHASPAATVASAGDQPNGAKLPVPETSPEQAAAASQGSEPQAPAQDAAGSASTGQEPAAGGENAAAAPQAGTEGGSTEGAPAAEPAADSETSAANEAGEAQPAGQGGAKKKRRRRRRKKAGAEATGEAGAEAGGEKPQEKKEPAGVFAHLFESGGSRKHAFAAGEVVAGRVTKVEQGVATVDLFGKAIAFIDVLEPREVPILPEPEPEKPEAEKKAEPAGAAQPGETETSAETGSTEAGGPGADAAAGDATEPAKEAVATASAAEAAVAPEAAADPDRTPAPEEAAPEALAPATTHAEAATADSVSQDAPQAPASVPQESPDAAAGGSQENTETPGAVDEAQPVGSEVAAGDAGAGEPVEPAAGAVAAERAVAEPGADQAASGEEAGATPAPADAPAAPSSDSGAANAEAEAEAEAGTSAQASSDAEAAGEAEKPPTDAEPSEAAAAEPPPPPPEPPKVGEILRGRVGSVAESGHIVLVNRIIDRPAAKARIRAARDAKQRVEGIVYGYNRGGFDVLVEGVRVFCPARSMSLTPIEHPDAFLGVKQEFTVSPSKGSGSSLVVGRRGILEREQRKQAKALLKTLQPGQRLTGTVTQVREFGVFVDIGGLEGLVHQSELSHSRGVRPGDVAKPGDQVEVQVLKLGGEGTSRKDRERVSLSMRALQPDPWDAHEELLRPGSVREATVVRLTDFGAFMQLAPQIEGLLHISELGRDLKHANAVLSEGQTLHVVVERVDRKQRRISLSKLSPAEQEAIDAGQGPDPEAKLPKPGRAVKVVVDRVENAGVVLRVPGIFGKRGRGFMPNSEVGTERGTDHRRMFPPGTELEVKVIGTDREGGLRCSRKALAIDEEKRAVQDYRKEVAKQGLGTFGDLLRSKLGVGKDS